MISDTIAFDAAFNAARIAREVGDMPGDTAETARMVAVTACSLSEIEREPGFDWEDCPQGFPVVCMRLANFIKEFRVEPSVRQLRQILKAPV
jgi:hypothetical protein